MTTTCRGELVRLVGQTVSCVCSLVTLCATANCSKASKSSTLYIFHAHLPSASLALLIFVRSHTTHATAAFPLKISRAFQFFQDKSCDLSRDRLTFCPLRPSHAPVRLYDRASDPCDRSEKQMIPAQHRNAFRSESIS